MKDHVTKPLDRDLIARAMKRAAKIAAHGTPEQRAGMFRPRIGPQAKQRGNAPRDPQL